jgi:hypothetical protein
MNYHTPSPPTPQYYTPLLAPVYTTLPACIPPPQQQLQQQYTVGVGLSLERSDFVSFGVAIRPSPFCPRALPPQLGHFSSFVRIAPSCLDADSNSLTQFESIYLSIYLSLPCPTDSNPNMLPDCLLPEAFDCERGPGCVAAVRLGAAPERDAVRASGMHGHGAGLSEERPPGLMILCVYIHETEHDVVRGAHRAGLRRRGQRQLPGPRPPRSSARFRVPWPS